MSTILAQSTNSSNELNAFQQAKVYAFDEGNYPKAISYINELLTQEPSNADLELFLSRMYFWSTQHENAISSLTKFLKEHKLNIDAHNLLIDIYQSQGHYHKAIKGCQEAIDLFPENNDFVFRLAYNQSKIKDYKNAYANCKLVLEKDKEHQKALNLIESTKPHIQQNFILAEYRYFFLNTPDQALNFYNLQYARKVKNTTFIGMLNMGKSLGKRGFQYNAEMYNKLGKKYYSYLHVGYSESTIFPDLRVNAAIYKAMPHDMEGSVFITLMKADGQYIRIISPSLTKNFGYSALSLTGNVISQSYETEITYRARFRQYISSNNNFVGIAVGSFSRAENLVQRTEEDLVAQYISYEAQIYLGLNVIWGLNYNRSLSNRVLARDQFTTYLRHNF